MKELSSLSLLISSIIQECSLKKLIGGDELFKSQSAGLPFVLVGLGKMAYCLSREIKREDLLVDPFIVTKKIPSNPISSWNALGLDLTFLTEGFRVSKVGPLACCILLRSNFKILDALFPLVS